MANDGPKNSNETSAEPTGAVPDKFCETLALMDDTTWVWSLCQSALSKNTGKYLRLPSNVTIRHSWSRFRNAPAIIVHWESKGRQGGAIIEEILDVDPNYDVAGKIIVLTSNPIHEDVVYFSELGVRRIVRIRNRDKELEVNRAELLQHIREAPLLQTKPTLDILWRKVLNAIDRLPEKPEEALLQRLEENILKLRGIQKPAARDIDALGSVYYYRGEHEKAFQSWQAALDSNPNYFRSYNNMIAAHRALGRHMEAYMLMQKMQMLNRSSITRLVAMGETQLALNDDRKAEHYFRSALEKDAWCSGALNGIAEIRFRQGDLDTARTMLEKSRLSYRYASKLNMQGIEMVRKAKYGEALEHYSKAQYVLPQQEKGPQLFYNIGLCYSRWNRPEMAIEFLKLAVIKEPNYKKAQKLMEQIQQHSAREGITGNRESDTNDAA